jgi:hypothetical protein
VRSASLSRGTRAGLERCLPDSSLVRGRRSKV